MKREIEKLQHRTTEKLNKITQDEFMHMIEQAAPSDIVDPFVIDNNLWMMISENNISLDTYVSPDKQNEIIDNSPSTIDIDGREYFVEYHGGEPRITRFQTNDILKMNGDVTLGDGRIVKFIHKKQIYSSSQLKNILQQA